MDGFNWGDVAALAARFASIMLIVAFVSTIFDRWRDSRSWPRRVRTQRGLIVVYENGATFLSEEGSGNTYVVCDGAARAPAYGGMDR